MKHGKAEPTYEITTWDMDKQEFTPQRGIQTPAVGQSGLRRSLRAAENFGYDVRRRGGYSILVERVD